MPKRRTEDVVHAVITDHYIQRRPPERGLTAEFPEHLPSAYRGDVALYYPPSIPKPEDELYVAIAQVIQSSNLRAGARGLAAAVDKFKPQRAEYYLRLGEAWRKSGRLDEAIRSYEEALRKQPDSSEALHGLAVCLISAKQQARAIEMLKRAPQDASTLQLLGTAYVELGRGSDAIAAFERAIELDPEMPEAYNSLGALRKSVPLLGEAIRLDPNYAEAHDNLANILSLSGNSDEASYHFRAALRIKPDNSAFRYEYAMALARARRLDEAQQQLEMVLAANGASAEAHELLGTVFGAKGQPDRAIDHYREALRIQPQFSRAQLHLGEALADKGDTAGAVTFLRKAAESSEPAIRREALDLLRKLGN